MAITAPGSTGGRETPDPAAAAKGRGSGPDRAGFDLGGSAGGTADAGSAGDSRPGSTAMPDNSADPAPATGDGRGIRGEAGPAAGGARSPGGPAGGGPEGEVVQPTAGGLRPPQNLSGDRTDTQGDDHDAA